MADAILTQKQLKEVLFYDAETGIFTRRVNSLNNKNIGDTAGSVQNGYVKIRVLGKMYRAHRLAWLYMTGAFPAKLIDHINGIGTDNRFSNLRNVSQSVNMQNVRNARANSNTGILGVKQSGSKYTARIVVDKKRHYLGTFDNAKLAHDAYIAYKRLHHAGCTI